MIISKNANTSVRNLKKTLRKEDGLRNLLSSIFFLVYCYSIFFNFKTKNNIYKQKSTYVLVKF